MEALRERFATLQVGEPIEAGDLTVFPLLGAQAGGPEYLTLDEAAARQLVEVMEVDKGGMVGEIAAKNLADTLVLIVEGEQLIGAKQNRTLNTSVLLPPMTTVRIPVSCTEAGRWRHASRGFRPSRHYSHPRMRRGKCASVSHSLRAGGAYRSDQRAVWEEVDRVAACMSVRSDTADYEEVMDALHRSPWSASHHLDAAHLPADAVGVVVATRGRIEMADIFDRPRTLQALWPKLSRGYAMCAIERDLECDALRPQATDVRRFLDHAASSAGASYPSPGVGHSVRMDGPGVTGACLAVGDHVIHASIFALSFE